MQNSWTAPRREAIVSYAAAVAAAMVAWALRLGLAPILGSTTPFVTFFAAVMIAAWFGGLGPAILAATLGVLAAAFAVTPPLLHFAFTTESDLSRAIIFYTFSIFISALMAALRRSRNDSERARDLLQTTLSSIGDGVIATDPEGNVTFLNAVAQGLTGWSQSEADGRPISEIFVVRNESTGQPLEDPVRLAIAQQAAVSLADQAVLVDKTGRLIPIEDSAAPILDLDRRLSGVVLVFRDVTARRQTQKEARRNEERLTLALSAGKIGVWDWNVADNRIEWSDQVYAIHRVSRRTFSGVIEDYVKLIHSGDRDRVNEAIKAALQQNAPYDVRFRIVRPSGEVRWVAGTGKVIRNAKGEPLRMLGAVTDITAEKQQEARLKQQWSTFDTVLSNTPDHHFILDLDGRFTYANRALLDLWQRPLEDVTGKNYFELGYPVELAARVMGQIQEVIMTARPVRDQTAYTEPSGRTRTWDYILVPAFSADGQIEAVGGSSRDITDRIRSEKALRESEIQLRLALEVGGGVGNWDWDIQGNRVFCNPEFAALFQVDPAVAATGAPIETFANHMHPDDRDRMGENIRAVLKERGNYADEYRVIHPAGVRWIFSRGRCETDANGEPSHLLGVAYDITDRKLASEELHESQQRLRAIYDGTYEFIGLLARDGTLLEANRSSLEFAQSSREQLIGQKFWETPWFAFTPGAAEKARDGVTRAAAGEFVRYEAIIQSPAGQTGCFDISFYPIRNEQGEVILIVPEGRDITGLKQAEEELRRTNDELTRVNRDLEEFAYVASHDLQEPLRMVNINAQRLLRGSEAGEDKFDQYATSIRQGVLRMDALLKDLLKFSQTVHSDDATAGVADLTTSLTKALSLLTSSIEESGAVINFSPLPAVRGETAQLSHVFQNLISNALKYRRSDVRPQISISAKLEGRDWIVSVIDNGIGFRPEQAERIFGLFKRLHSDEYEGTGLGLAICKRIIERYGGRIWAKSAPGEGSTFYFALPAIDGR